MKEERSCPLDVRHWWHNIKAFFGGHHKCLFCKRYCNRGELPLNTKGYRWWFCHQCDTSYYYHDVTNELNFYRFIRQINGKEFMLYLTRQDTRLFVEKLYDHWGSAPAQILYLDYKLNNVNPQNAIDKIKTLLTFS